MQISRTIRRASIILLLVMPLSSASAQRQIGGDISARQFGAAGNDTSADDAALNTLMRKACSREVAEKTVYIPGGFYRLTQPVVIPCGLTITGDGDATVLRPLGNLDALTFSTTARVQIQNLAISYVGEPTAGTAAISCAVPNGSSGTGLTVRDVSISNAYTGLAIRNCPFFILSANRIFSFRSAGVTVANPTNADVGDGVIENNSFFNFGPAKQASGVVWTSGGGVRIINNKFGALDGGVKVRLAAGARTSQIFIANNSFDTMQSYGLSLRRLARDAFLTDVLYNGNVCTSCQSAISIPRDTGGAWVSNIVATGSTFIGLRKKGVIVFDISSADNLAISGNALFSNDPSTIAVKIGPDVDGAVIAPMAKAGPWAGDIIQGSAVSVAAIP